MRRALGTNQETSTEEVGSALRRPSSSGSAPESAEAVRVLANVRQPRANERAGWWRIRYLHARHVEAPVWPEAWNGPSGRARTLEEVEDDPRAAFERQSSEWAPWTREEMLY